MPTEQALPDGLDGVLWLPDAEPRAAVLVVAGSSGRIDADRARVLAGHGVLAASIRWFGGPGQPPGICEVPLETFTAALDELRRYHPARLAMLGTSKGAEAALLVAERYAVDHVVAISPTSVVWANVGPGADGWGTPYRSSWTWGGEPLPFVPYDDTWPEPAPPVACRILYERSLAAFPADVDTAAIQVENVPGDVTLVAGADDQMWPSDLFARVLAARRRAAGRPVTLLDSDAAGHRPYFPGEPEPAQSTRFVHGGTPAADAALGARTLTHLLAVL